jgi:membrane-bound serine protease (ClpP class)
MFAGVVMSLLALDLRVSWDLGFLNEALFTVSTAIVGAGVAGVLLVRFLPSTRTARRMVLSETLKAEDGFSSHDEGEKESFPPGTAGEVITDLRPAGKVKIDGARIDAVSEGDFIGIGARVTIVAWRSGNAIVREDT